MTHLSDANKALVVRFWSEVLNGQNFDLMKQLLSSSYQFNGKPSTYEDNVAWVKGMHAKMPDMKFKILAVVAEDVHVAIRWLLDSGTETAIGANFITLEGGQAISNDQAGGDHFTPKTLTGS